MNNRKLILSIAKKHYLNKDWYAGWSTDTDWQKCIFDAVKELYGYETAGIYTETAFVLLKAAGIIISDCKKAECLEDSPSNFCFKVMDKYYSYSFHNNIGMEIE